MGMELASFAASKGKPEAWLPSFSEDERSLRQDLAASYRLAAHFGWSDLIFTHFSAKVPGSDGHFLINPYGWLFDQNTASSLVKIDLDGNVVGTSPYPV